MPNRPRLLEFDGRTLPMEHWSREKNIPLSTLKSRLDVLGWDVARALSTPIDHRFRKGGRRKKNSVRPCPRLRENKAKGLAFVEWVSLGKRHTIYLGPIGSEDAKKAYKRFAAEWAAGQHVMGPSGKGEVLVYEVIERWLAHCELTYVKRGKITSEVHCNRRALAIVAELYLDTPAAEFDCDKLEAVRAAMLAMGWYRKTINDHVARVQRAFSWAVTKKLVPAAVADALKHLQPIQAGRTSAPESQPKKPVPAEHIEAIFPHLHPNPKRRAVVEAMIRFQRLTGVRPGELCSMRPEDIDRSDEVWAVTVTEFNKMLHRDVVRTVLIGPKAQAVIAPVLATAEPGQPIFRFPPWWSRAKWSPITVGRYRGTIARACKAAGVPVWTPHRLRHNRATEVQRLYEDDRAVGIAIGDTPEVARQVYSDNPAKAVAKRIAMATG